MKGIDLDSHARPRSEDYEIEPEYKHLRPRSYVDAKGNVRHLFHNRILSVRTGRERQIADTKGKKHWGPANYDGSVRHEQIDESDIDFQFISGGTIGAFTYIDAKIGAAFCRAANNFLYRSFMKPYPKTFSILPDLPLQDIAEAIKELERCVKNFGMRAFRMPTNWNNVDMADPHWWNFYDRVRELGITGIIIHVGLLSAMNPWIGKDRLRVLGPDGTTGRRIVGHPFEYCANIVNLIFGGMMDSFPEFRFAFLEAGAEFAIVLKHRIEENLP